METLRQSLGANVSFCYALALVGYGATLFLVKESVIFNAILHEKERGAF